MATSVSKSLLVNSKVNDTNETSAMLLIMNAVAEAKQKNIKKCVVEFNQSLIETQSNDDLFLSKLLELPFADLDILHEILCCSSEKNRRRSSKQHEKKGSFKKRSMVAVEDCSFANAAFEDDLKKSVSGTSLGRRSHTPSLSDENMQAKKCLQKAFNLAQNILKTDLRVETFRNIVNVHLKVGNYYPCTVCCVQFKEKAVVDQFLCTLDDAQSLKICQICLVIASEDIRAGHILDAKSRLDYSKLAYKLQPNMAKVVEVLCKHYRLNNETEKALTTANVYLEEIDLNEGSIILLKTMCLIDFKRYDAAKANLKDNSTDNEMHSKQLDLITAILHFLLNENDQGIEMIKKIGIVENQKLIKSTLDLLNLCDLKRIAQELYEILTLPQKRQQSKEEIEEQKHLAIKLKCILNIVGDLMTNKSENDTHKDMETAKLYIDCLYICEKPDDAQAYLIQLVKENPDDTLPMVFLANIRLKVGAYVASEEDFRVLLSMYGQLNLKNNLTKLSLDEREEIARVHQLRGFRYLSREKSYEDAIESFTIAICALSESSALSLFLLRGYCHMHANNFDSAMSDFTTCIAQNSTLASALCARAVLYAVTTHVEEALRDFHKAFLSDPLSCQQCLPKLPLEQVLVFSQLLVQYVKQAVECVSGTYKKTAYDFDDVDKNFNNSENHSPKQIYNLKEEYLNYSEFLHRVFPNNIEYISAYIECLYLSDDTNTACLLIYDSIKSFPNELILRVWNCILLAKQWKIEDAMIQLTKASYNVTDEQSERIFLYLSSKVKRALFDRLISEAQKALESNNNMEALSYFNFSEMLYTSNVEIARGRMTCYKNMGEHKKWLKDLSTLLQLQPSVHDFCTRATYYYRQGELFKACEDFISALEINENDTRDFVGNIANYDDIVRLFHDVSLSMADLNKPKFVARLCEAGLKFDTNHKELRQLKEKHNDNRCVIQ